MSWQPDISVVVSTYNRRRMLEATLSSVLAQEAGGLSYELLVVDNNSTDGTREAAEAFVARGGGRVRYFFEPRQGVSHARNTGIANARAPIVAFTDDDVCVAPDWLARIKRAFDEHPEVDMVGGKVLPLWPSEPPAWLRREHWPPLALIDYGEEPFHTNAERPVCLVSANLAFRRAVFEHVGLFDPGVQLTKGSVGSVEDDEIERRVWRAGRLGLYEPGVVVHADVQPERMTRDYHRRWHEGHGRYYAIMHAEDVERASLRLFDVPGPLYRQAAADALGWLKSSLRRSGGGDDAFVREARLRFFLGFFRKRREDFRAAGGRDDLRELAAFVRALLGRKK